jgi:hypothetical protein
MALSRYEKFEIIEIKRTSIQNAFYNPRKINDKARAKLKKNLKKKGLLQPLVWNEQTKNLVSGHQRIDILDELEGNSDYSLKVAKVSLSPKEEKEQNLFFNNANAMGEWDLLELEDLFKSENFDYQEAGFEIADLNALDIELFSTENLTLEESTLIAKEPNLSQEQRADIVKDMKKNIIEEANSRNTVKPMFSIVFDDSLQFEQFLDKFGLQGTYCSYHTFSETINA